MKLIEIIVKSDGATTVETTGFTGASCQQASRFIEEALGQRQREQLTPEYSHVNQGQQVRNQQGG